MTAIIERIKNPVPSEVGKSPHSRAVLLNNLPFWGAALAAAILIVSIVIRPCAQLLYISMLYLWNSCVNYGVAWGQGSGSLLSIEEAALGCNVGIARAIGALRYMDTGQCPMQTLEGTPCGGGPTVSQFRKSKHSPLPPSFLKIDPKNISVCPAAALEFESATKRLTNWFTPFYTNGSVTCAHTRWFNITPDVPGIVTSTSSGRPVVFWYPYIEDINRHHRGQKLSLIVFSHISQKEELMTYNSVVNIGYLTPKIVGGGKETGENGTAEVVMMHNSMRLTGGTAHCVQWLLEAY